MTRWPPVLALGLLFAMVGGSAQAATPAAKKEARRSFERAEAHFKAGLFAEALAEYQDGYDHVPLPGFLINIAQCQRRLGDLKQARATYRKFLMVAPDSPYVPEVTALIAELDKLIDAPDESAPPPATKPEKAEPDRGSSWGAATAGKDLSLPAAAATKAASNPLVTSTATPAPVAETGTRWWLWGTIGAAVVAGTVTAVLLLRSPGTTTLHEGSLGTLRR
jgi:tetratricopeptide (TPR) repeat protein